MDGWIDRSIDRLIDWLFDRCAEAEEERGGAAIQTKTKTEERLEITVSSLTVDPSASSLGIYFVRDRCLKNLFVN